MKKIFLISIVSLLTINLFGQLYKLAIAAENLVDPNVKYDTSYVKIAYPKGDIPNNRGGCADVIIRAFRELETDLQRYVHEDIVANPKIYGKKTPDTNIDHRRVHNLMKYFERKIRVSPITDNPKDYKPGEIVVWDLGNGKLHIGIISATKSKNNPNRYMVVHNVCCGQVKEDRLFEWKIIGHYDPTIWRF
jgi:uncharacterized protein YijF (DUF1287 family)